MDRHCALHTDCRDAKRDDLQREAAGTARSPAGLISDIFSVAGDSTMDQHDQELLEKQLRAINGAPPRAGVIIVTMLTVFLAGITLGGLVPPAS
jgi:hypothetical protein